MSTLTPNQKKLIEGLPKLDPRRLSEDHRLAVESAITLVREKELLLKELHNLRLDSLNKAYSAMIPDFEALAKRLDLPMLPDTASPAARILNLFKAMVERVDAANKAMQRLHGLAGVPAGQDPIEAIEFWLTSCQRPNPPGDDAIVS